MSLKIEGLDDLERRLEDLQRRAENLDGEHQVKIEEILTSDFIQRFTDFMTLDEMFEASGLRIGSQADFDALSDDQLDPFVRERTLFGSWSELMEKAMEEWTAKRLGL